VAKLKMKSMRVVANPENTVIVMKNTMMEMMINLQ
jgi:hypothetical protein